MMKGTIEALIRHIYLNGPSSLGFHEGVDLHEVCGRISSTPSHVWLGASVDCELMVARRVGGFNALAQIVIAIYLALSVIGLVTTVTRAYVLVLTRKYFGGVGVQPHGEFLRVALDGGEPKVF